MCNVVQKTPNNNAQEKILFNVILVFLGQHCTDQNPMQCCPWGSRQQCTILFNDVLNLLEQHCTGKSLVHCCLWDSRQHYTRKNLVQCCLNTFGTTLHKQIPYAMLFLRLQTTLYKKKFLFYVVSILLGQHCTSNCKILVQCCPKGTR